MLSTIATNAIEALVSQPLLAQFTTRAVAITAARHFGASSISSHRADRPTSTDPDVVRARMQGRSDEQQPDEILGNSMSDGVYAPSVLRRRVSFPLSSISEPETYWSGSSLSDGFYEMPGHSLRAAPRAIKKSHMSAGPQSLPLMQRVVTMKRQVAMADDGPLHNSYSHSGY